jgi:hypothetical protein
MVVAKGSSRVVKSADVEEAMRVVTGVNVTPDDLT